MKSLLGKNFSDPEVQEEMKKLPFKIVPLEAAADPPAWAFHPQ